MRRLSLYAGAGTSVNPSIENMTQTTPTAAVVALKPERSRTYEVGAKWDGFAGKLLLNAALFRTDKLNARTPGLPGEPATVLEGKQRVDGFEFGATGRITKAWDVIASYTYLDSEIRESNTPAEVGNRLGQRARCTAGRCGRPTNCRSGSRSAAACATSARASPTSPMRARSTDYVVADATLGYEFSRDFTLRLNAFNLFDKRFADQISGGHFIPGPGRSVLATLSIRR